jgi:exonuclease SbcC
MTMILRRLTISRFRGFAREKEFVFGTTNLVGGPNGFGKTSVFDAVQWCLFGKVPRLSGSRDFTRAGDVYRNLFSKGAPSVSVEFEGSSGEILYRRRSGNQCVSRVSGEAVDDAHLLQRLGLSSEDAHAAFLRNYMLQQETINEFVRDLNPRDRYDSMLYLLNDETPRLLLERTERLANDCQSIVDDAKNHLERTKDRRERLETDVSELEEIKARVNVDYWSAGSRG